MQIIPHQQTIVHALNRASQPLTFGQLVEATQLNRELVQQCLDKLAEVYLVTFDLDQKTYQINLPTTVATPPATPIAAAPCDSLSVPQQVRQHLEAAPQQTLSVAELAKRVDGSRQAINAALQHWRKKNCVRIVNDGWQWQEPPASVPASDGVPAGVQLDPAPVLLPEPTAQPADVAELDQIDQTLARFTRQFRIAVVNNGSLEIQNHGGKLTLSVTEAAALNEFMRLAAPLIGAAL
ncbi:hypothetical protein [Chromobacterium sp. IRSSSOUMB001]|uniref:hypothetical protein n=1 Tax=Chromobacterium sp. IRSSSOUMB001 TaxID=2927123 RepID=UPI0020BE2A46|nr:hypothetical protein [Chromobacterium sp. IRSSSOUMB001]